MNTAFRIRVLVGVMTGAFVGPTAVSGQVAQQARFAEEASTFADGTQYRMRVPLNWNGTLINDLDYANDADSERNRYWLGRGYAISGTARPPLRSVQYDPAREVSHLLKVLEIFEERFGKPMRIIQHGYSGGGFVALLIAEQYPERVDGVVAGCAHVPVWVMNLRLDASFVLKALLDPSLQVAEFPVDGAAMASVLASWRQVIAKARATPAGRARLALAAAIGQWPLIDLAIGQPRVGPYGQYRDSVQQAVDKLATAFYRTQPGGQAGWNAQVDYRKLFETSGESDRRIVQQRYREANLDLGNDLDSVNAFPRISVNAEKIAFWSGRTVTGDPKVPVLRTHTLGDLGIPVNVVDGYGARVRERGKADNYRTAFVDRAGHCTFSVAESTAALETLIRRLDTGRWDNTTDAPRLNALSATLHTGDAKFVDHVVTRLNRAWFPER